MVTDFDQYERKTCGPLGGVALVAMILAVMITLTFLEQAAHGADKDKSVGKHKEYEVMKTDEQWRKELTPEEYHILREKGTERAFTGKYHNSHEDGVYICAACGQELFGSDAKFDSGTGWPSYFKPVDEDAVDTEEDRKFGMSRTEVVCSRCGGHLGHVFPDGPKPTGLRYCINSAALDFKADNAAKADAAKADEAE